MNARDRVVDPSVRARRRRLAVLAIGALALVVLPGTPVWATARAIGARAVTFIGRSVAPAFGPRASSLPPSIGVSMIATLASDTDGDLKADPGDRIRYTTTITNSGGDPATGVRLVDAIPSGTTLVPGSVVISPVAFDETYQSTGNMTLSSGAIGPFCSTQPRRAVTCNDTLNGAVLTAFGDTAAHAADTVADGTTTVTTANGGTVRVHADGTFVYNPSAGFAGPDTFWYTLSNATVSPSLTDTGQVTIEVGGAHGMAWFISPSGGGDGTQVSPIGMAAFQAKNTLASPSATDPHDGDTIFPREGSHVGPLTLRASQKLIGEEETAGLNNLGAPARPGNDYGQTRTTTPLTISGSPVAVVLNTDNTIAGFTAGGASSFAISGGAVGALKIAGVVINNPSGGGFAIATGGTVSGGSFPFRGFDSIVSVGGTYGVTLTNVHGAITIGQSVGGTLGRISDASIADINIAGGTVNLTSGGIVEQIGGTGAVLSVSGGHSGTVTVTSMQASGGSGLQFDNADGTYTATGMSGRLSVTSGATAGINITNGSGGTFQFAANTTIDNPNGVPFSLSNSNATVTYSGTISTSRAGAAISIDNHDSGAITFDTGSLSSTGLSGGIVVQNSNGGTINFNQPTKTLSTGANPAVTLNNNNHNGFITFGNGGLAIATTSGAGFSATGGGALAITTGTNPNTITTTTGTALNVSNTTINEAGLTFQSITAGTEVAGPANAIVLNTTFIVGGLTVTGVGTTAGSGGTIQNTVQGAVFSSTSLLWLSNMNFTNANSGNGVVVDTDSFNFNDLAQAAINMTNVTTASFTNLVLDGGGGAGGAQVGINGVDVRNLTIANTTVTGFGDAAGEGAVKLWNLMGTCAITGSTFSFASGDTSAGERLVEIRNEIGFFPLALTVTGSTFKDTRSSANGSSGLAIRSVSDTTMSVSASNNDFLNLKTSGVEVFARDFSTLNVDLVDGNVFDPQGGSGRAIALSAEDTAHLNFNVNRNEKIYGRDVSILDVRSVDDAVISGRINDNPDIQGGGAGSFGPAIYLQSTGESTATVEVAGNTMTASGRDAVIFALARGNVASGFSAALDATIRNNTITILGSGSPSAAYGIWTAAGVVDPDATRICASVHNNTVSRSSGNDVAWLLRQGTTASHLYVEGWDVNANTTWNGRGNVPANATSVQNIPGSPALGAPPAAAPYFGACRTPSNTTAMLGRPRSLPMHAALDAAQASRASLAATGTGDAMSRLRSLAARLTRASSAPAPQQAPSLLRRLRAYLATVVGAAARTAQDLRALAIHAADGLTAPLLASGETVDLGLGTLPAGKTLTVAFDVTVDTPPLASYSNHATIASTTASFSDADTNTVTTTGDRYDTTTLLVSSLNPAEQVNTVTFTATVTPAEGSGMTPDGTIQFNDGGSPIGGPVACVDVGANTCSAQLTTSSLATGTRSITAGYSGGTHHDPSTSNTVSQENAACTSNPVVANNNDSGPGSLRQAIADACGTNGHNTITFAGPLPSVEIELSGGQLELTRDLNVVGPGATRLIIASSPSGGRVMHVNPGIAVTLSDLSFVNGRTDGSGLDAYGGAILNEQSALTIVRSVIRDSLALNGAAVASVADGAPASLTIVDSTVVLNQVLLVTGQGGGIMAFGQNGGVSTLAITNSTISQNRAATGAGIALGGGATATITNATITANSAYDGVGLFIDSAATALLRNTIVAGNLVGTAAADVDGALDGSSSHNLIGVDGAMTGIVHGSNGNQVGTPASPLDPKLGPLDIAGGFLIHPHLLLRGSPAIDAGDNAFVIAPPFIAASPITDQRGAGFVRIADGADADATATVDIGAIEAQTTIGDIADRATLEDTPLSLSFNVGDAATVGFDAITATSGNPALVTDANLVITGSGSTRTLTITPTADAFGTATITARVSKTIGGAPQDAVDTFVLSVTSVNDRPTLDPIGGPAILEDSALVTFELTGISSGSANESQTLTVTATSDNQALIPDPVSTYTSPDTAATLSFRPEANATGTAVISVTVQDSGGTANGGLDTIVRQFSVHVASVADTPSVTRTTTAEDTLSAGGLVVTRNPADASDTTHVRITNIQHGSLFLLDGVTPVTDGQFLTFAQAGAGLRFRGATDFFGTASFDAQASISDGVGGLGGGIVTASITITPVTETPQVTGAATLAQVQSTTGLVITPDPADAGSVTHYKISSISSGTLDQNDGVSPIAEGEFISVADGAAGLMFTPADGFTGTATFAVQAATDNLGAGLSGAVTASIVVTRHATTTSLVSADPNPSDRTQPVDVVFTVTSADGGPAPEGTVTVVVAGSFETCTGTVAAGQCTVTSTVAGTRNIVATYNGDALNLGSDAAVSHTFNDCATNQIVQSAADSGPYTLRDAVANACYGSTIAFGIAETVTLSSPIDVLKNMTILGSGPGLRLSGANANRVLHIGSGVSVTVDNLTIADGAADFGAGIHNEGDLTIVNSTLSGNAASVNGGAIANLATLTVRNSTLSGNTAATAGGGIWAFNGSTTTVVNSTISGNTAGTVGAGLGSLGGGINTDLATLALINVTITGNYASIGGGISTAGTTTAANSIIAANDALGAQNVGGAFTEVGPNLTSGDPMLGPLHHNGGPTFTHMPLIGSPALDAGDNAVATDAGLTTDQRGAPYARVLDAADADTTQTADLGAVEADPTLPVIPDQTFDEGGSAVVTFNVGDSTTPFDSILALSDNPLLLLFDPVDLTSGGSTRTLTLTPDPNGFGVAHITIRARKRLGADYQTTESTFTVTVNRIADPPTLDPIADATTPEDVPLTLFLTGISFGPGEDQVVPMTMTVTSSNTALIPNLPQNLLTSFNGMGPVADLSIRPLLNKFGTSTITVTLTDDTNLTVVRTFLVTVTPVADRPRVSATGAFEDQPSFPFTITRNAQDGAEVTHFKITNITGGTLALIDETPVPAGQFITLAQGAAGLTFMPSPNSTVTGQFTVQGSTSDSDAGLGGPLVIGNVPVESIADPPIVTGATTPEDTQSTSGLVITRNAVDGPDVTHFRVLQANSGTLYLPGSTTPISGADLITVAQGAAGLRFTPFPNFSGSATIVIAGLVDSPFTGLGEGEPGTATVTVTPVADTPSITSASTTVNAQTPSGLVVSRSPVDNSEVTHVKVTAIGGGQLFQQDGVTSIGVGSFITMDQGAAGLRFTPAVDSATAGQVTIQASTSNSDAGLGGGTATASITVSPAASTTTVVTSKTPSDLGELVTFTATVTAPVGTLTGTVQFKADFVAIGSPVPLVNGQAAVSTATLLPGQTEIQAVYSGDALAAPSAGLLPGTQRVRAPVNLMIRSSGNPRPFGSAVTITADAIFAVDDFTGPVSGGTVTFKEGATTLGVAPVSDGSSSLTTSALTLGTHHLSAEYGGSDVFMPATGTFDQIISCPVMVILPSAIAPAVLGVPYTQTFTHGGGVGVIAFTLTGTLPAGLSFDAATATLSGVPLVAGRYPIQVVATPAYACAAATASYTLSSMSGRSLLTGADAGGAPHVRRFAALDGGVPRTGALTSFMAFDPLFNSGVRVAEGDVNGDGEPDYIFGAGPGGAPEVRIVDGATGALRASIAAFEPEFRGGVFVAAGDVNGDGFVDVIAASGEGRAGEVKVFSGRDLSVIADTLVFEPAFTGGVRVAAGDVNGDGLADLVAGAGPGATTVTVLSGADLAVLRTLTAYPGFAGGVFVAAGDVTGDGYADLVTGAGAGGGPHVRVFDGRTGAETHGFFAFDVSLTAGVRVAAGDVNADGHAEIIVGAGPGGAPEVRVFDLVTSTLVNTVLAYAPGWTGGVFVATAVPISQMVIDTPQPNATVRSAFTLSGWAFEDGSGTAGIAGIVVLAVPVDGGEPIAVGPATMGDPRPDVAAIYGGRYANAGFHRTVSGLPPGVYDLHVLARGAVSRVTNMRRIVRVTVAPDPQPILAIDTPAPGRLSGGDFAVAGWALTPETQPAPGVDAIHVWAAPVGGGAWTFLGAPTLGVPRPDVASVFGSQFAQAGYYLNVTGLAPGTWDLLVFPRRTGTAAFAAPQIVRVTVSGGSTRSIITGADAGGGPHVKRFGALDGGPPMVGALSSFFAFDASFMGGVRIAEGDMTGDGVPDYIAGAGPGGAPEVRVIDGASGTIRASIVAFEPEFRGGVFVAAGDVNGDGFVDVIAGSGEGRRGQVKVFSGRDGTLIRDGLVFDPAFRGGVHVAAGDVNGDGYADPIAGAGAGGSEVVVLNAIDLSVLWTVTPYPGFFGGAFVAAGDVTGDGVADVITGAGPSGSPHVRVFDGRTGVEATNFFAYEGGFSGGVRVAVGDVTGDGRADVITGPGPGRAPEARVFDAATGTILSNVLAYTPSFTHGVFVATAAPVHRMAIDTPANGAIVHGPFTLAGWAFNEHPSSAGLDAIHVWAFPVAGGSPTFGGVATLGLSRPDVAAIYGAQYANAGFSADIAGLAPGVYDVVAFAHSVVSGTFTVQRVVRVTVTP